MLKLWEHLEYFDHFDWYLEYQVSDNESLQSLPSLFYIRLNFCIHNIKNFLQCAGK